MDDEELLGIARKHEAFLLRMESGEIENGFNSAIATIQNNPTCLDTSVAIAQILAAMKRFVLRSDVMADLLEIQRVSREAEEIEKKRKHA